MDPKPPVATVPAGTATPAAPASTTAVTPEPAKSVQPAPAAAAKPGVAPEPAKPAQPQMVPIASLLEERAKRQELEALVGNLRTQVQTQAPQPPPAAPAQPPTVAAQELERLWENDPRRAVQAEMGMALEWYDRQNAFIEEQADQLASKAPDFNNYRSATMRYVRSLPINQRNNPRIVESAYFYVRGQGLDDLLRQRDEELMRKFQTGELGAQASLPPGTFPAAATPAVGISPEEKAVADAMGISEEEYAKYRKPGGR